MTRIRPNTPTRPTTPAPASEPNRHALPSRFTPWLFFLGFALLAALVHFGGIGGSDGLPPDVNPVSASADSPRYVTQKIRDIQVGTWVLADNPELGEVEDEYGTIRPSEWRKIVLRMKKADGSVLDIDYLRPLAWLDDQHARVGSTIRLQVGELGIDGLAEVRSVTSCPKLPDRPSERHRLVTGKYAHSSGDVLDVHIDGLAKPIGTTTNHPFWSADRQEFVQAGSLRSGERVLSADGSLSPITQIVSRPGREPVYNLETETEHVYYVSQLGVLVHNAGKQYARRFDSKKNIKSARKKGIAYDENVRHPGIPAATTDIDPVDPDKIKEMLGARNADAYVDIDITDKKYITRTTKEGHVEIVVQESIEADDIVDWGRVLKSGESTMD